MSAPSPAAHTRSRQHSPLGQASLVLLKSVMADDWGPETAGRELVARVRADRRLLELLRARVARAMLGRTTRTDLRAAATLDRALDLLSDPAGHHTVPTQRNGGRR